MKLNVFIYLLGGFVFWILLKLFRAKCNVYLHENQLSCFQNHFSSLYKHKHMRRHIYWIQILILTLFRWFAYPYSLWVIASNVLGLQNNVKQNDPSVLIDMEQEVLAVNLLSRKRRRKTRLTRAQRNQKSNFQGVIEEKMGGMEIEDEDEDNHYGNQR